MLHISPDTLEFLKAQQKASEARARLKAQVKAARATRELGEKRRRVVVERTARILELSQSSQFEYEGACRVGLRNGLIGEGWKWADADGAAADVIEAAFKSLGVVRPTWDQGQPERINDRERWFCERCAGKIDVADRGPTRRYCSHLCVAAAHMDRARKSGERRSAAEYQAARAARKEARTAGLRFECEACNEPFQADHPTSRFCSRTCSSRHNGALQRAENNRRLARPCLNCGNPFRPKRTQSKFCSTACVSHSQKTRATRACTHCSQLFVAKKTKTRFCSPSCGAAGRASARGATANQSNFICEEIAP